MSEVQPDTRLIIASFTIPQGTSIASPATQTVLPDVGFYVIDSVEVIIPFGVSQLAGFQITASNEPIIPWKQNTTFITAEDEKLTFPVGYQTSGQLTLKGINSDINDHTFTFRFFIRDYVISATVSTGAAILQPIA